MIKKYTPSKDFSKQRRESSCCRSFFEEDLRQEKSIDISLKNPQTPTKRRGTPSHTYFQERQDFTNLTLYSFRTPKTSVFPSRIPSNGKTLHLTATTADHSSGFEPFLDLKPIEIQPNPLQRLKRRLTYHKTPSISSEQSSNHSHKITFNYLPPSYHSQTNQKPYQIAPPPSKSKQLQRQLQASLQKEIQDYKKEYQLLIQQFQRLKEEKEDNRQCYKELLRKIYSKEQEILELERLRRQELKTLKDQLEEYLQNSTNPS